MPDFLKLCPDFYTSPTLELSKNLLGKILVKPMGETVLAAKIVETEAYLQKGDEACHAFRGKTERNQHMFGEPGTLYVYFTYGCHFMLNVVSEPKGTAGAVLVRALEPISGIELMQKNRSKKNMLELTNGPGKLTQAFGIEREFSGKSLQSAEIFLADAPQLSENQIGTSTRIGITKSRELAWRFFIKTNPFVSKGKPS
ncbi:DNA-3-methyladenine glycosylase [Chloroherpeton thalassium ATCC 35110]|uniref:Putative 3-methyladenine DNA glycosylase n=1 Tax=Chloroherpeton thalassium (strain ATCC 35110 / GB-78) TaxID=517418 RepID=B3QYD1_CHLT3|nr:DNA-3-methyladenine glycosylase [Chloroherpeton thalassium]ACF15097.1 DNA-3-methyladenine glycosylase [Chloroherpeton thalassium ATCC 35110]